MPRAQTNCAKGNGHKGHCRPPGYAEYQRKYYRKYLEDNREAIAERQRRWNEDNREAVLERMRRYYEDNREAIVEQKRRYREENREAVLEYQRRWRNLTIMGATSRDRQDMPPEEQAAYLAECGQNLGKDFYEIVLGEGNDA